MLSKTSAHSLKTVLPCLYQWLTWRVEGLIHGWPLEKSKQEWVCKISQLMKIGALTLKAALPTKSLTEKTDMASD